MIRIHPDLITILRVIQESDREDRIADALLNRYSTTHSEGDYLAYLSADNQLSYRPRNRMDTSDPWGHTGRMKGRPARIVRRFLNAEIQAELNDTHFERFTNNLAAFKDYVGDIEFVSGEAIRHWYHGNVYADRQGTLNHSCMAYARCQTYFDIYTKNPDVCQLLIVTRTVDDYKYLYARALVWTLDDGTRMLDRVYGTDAMMSKVKAWAEDQGIVDREDITPSRKVVTLTHASFARYPYMDTMRVLNRKTKQLTSIYPPYLRHSTLCILSGTHGTDWSGPREVFLIPIIRQPVGLENAGTVQIAYASVEAVSARGAERSLTYTLRNTWPYVSLGRNGLIEPRAHVKGMAPLTSRWRKMTPLEKRYFGMETHAVWEDA